MRWPLWSTRARVRMKCAIWDMAQSCDMAGGYCSSITLLAEHILQNILQHGCLSKLGKLKQNKYLHKL